MAETGAQFEKRVTAYLEQTLSTPLQKQYSVEIGGQLKRPHRFDLGNDGLLVECKAYKWGTTPDAALHNWDRAMYCFLLAGTSFQKYFVVKKSYNAEHSKTLLEYYLEHRGNFVPNDARILELDEQNTAREFRYDESAEPFVAA